MANAILVEPMAVPAIATSSSAVGAAAHLLNDYRGTIWRSVPGDTCEIAVDLGADRPLDTIMLFGLGGNIPTGALVRVMMSTEAQGNARDDPSKYWIAPDLLPPFAGAVPIAPGNGVFLYIAPFGAPSAARYLWLTFIGLSGGYVEAARLVINNAFRLERNFGNGARFGVRDLGSLDFSQRGVLLRRRAPKLRTVALTFTSIHRDEVDAKTKPLLERIGNTEMVALVTDPDPDPMRQTRCYFGPLVGDLGHTHRRADFYEAGVNIVSIF